MKLIMILLVRDEVDIVRKNIEFHLNNGVDHVIAIDNGSIDGTRDILADLARSTPVTIQDEPARDYAQSTWVTRAIFQAREALHADWIFSNDADEFWIAPDLQIKDVLNNTSAHMLQVTRRNMVYAYDAPPENGDWAGGLVYRVAVPMLRPAIDDIYTAPLPCPYFYMNLPPKVIFRAEGFREIGMGNHGAVFETKVDTALTDMVIYHYPVRSAAQFERKVIQGGAAFLNHKNLGKMTGWHWRRWHRMEQAEGIGAPLREALPSQADIAADLAAGRLLYDTRGRDVLLGQVQ
jgi:glycosyltransferase involved in cell wall biosynthesis